MTLRFGAANVAWVIAAVVTVTPAVVRGGEECSGCSLLGSLSVSLASQEPAEPQVGDVVTFTYNYSAQLPGGLSCTGGCTFSGGAPVLEGDDPVDFSGDQIVVQRMAVAAGTTTVELQLRAETEEQCLFNDPELGCMSFFQPAFIDATSGPHEVSVAEEPPTPTPTSTQVPTETPTPQATATATLRRGGGDEDDGCTVAPPASPSSGLLLLLVLPILWGRGCRSETGMRRRRWRSSRR